MAAKKRKSEKRTPPRPEVGSLHEAILSALRRLVDHEGSIAAVARLFGFRRQRLSRWLSRGIPADELRNETALVQLASAIFARLAQLDRNEPARESRDRRIENNRAARELLQTFGDRRERKRLVEALEGWCRRHDEVAKFRGIRQSGTARFALELGVPVSALRRAIAPGRQSVGVKLFQAFRQFEANERAQAIEDEVARGKMEELMELARVPETYTVMASRLRRRKINGVVQSVRETVPIEREEPVIAKVPNGDWEFGGAGTFGRRWGMSIGQYLTPRIHPSGRDGWAVVEKFVRFALKVPGLLPSSRYPEWSVYMLASELGDEETGSNAKHRELDHEDSRRFAVNEVYSGGNHRGVRARERSVAKMIEKIGVGLDGTTLIYVHGGIAWNFRCRTEAEKQRREERYREDREFEATLRDIAARVAKKKADQQKKRARVAKRKKILAGVMSRRSERKKK